MEKEIRNMRRNMNISRAARNAKLVCAVFTDSGGTAKAFSTLDELATYIYGMSGCN